MKTPLISIIIPVYNTGDKTVKLLDRLVKDRYENLEIICVDDGSKDDSFSLLSEFCRQQKLTDSKKKIVLIQQENAGPAAARNTALKKIHGELVAFIDSDDTVSKNYLSEMSKLLTNKSVAVVTAGFLYKRIHQKTEKEMFTNQIEERRADEDYKTYILKNLASDGRLYASVNKMFRAEIIKKYNLEFPLGWDFAEDTNFVLHYLECARLEGLMDLKFLAKPYYIYHYGTETSTVASSSLPWRNWQRSFNYLKTWVGDNPTKDQKYWLLRVMIRWRISHALAVARSNQAMVKKWKYLNPLILPFASLAAKIRK